MQIQTSSLRRLWRLKLLPVALLAVWLTAGCAGGIQGQPPAASPEPAPQVRDVAAPGASATAPGAATSAPLPMLVADIPVAPPQQTIRDLALDPAANLVYVTDTADQLHVLDASGYTVVKTLALGGNLLADPDNHRLYVYMPYGASDEPAVIHVIDTTSLEEIGTLPGRAIAVDSRRNRLFVGEPYSSYLPSNGTSVRVIDGATLQTVREIPQPGTPVYNPVRDELLIVAYTLYTVDADTGAVTGDLFPELTSGELADFLWCNSCAWVDHAFYDAASGLIAVDLNRHCTGGGCGNNEPTTFLDAATLAVIPDRVAPMTQVTCGNTPHVLPTVDGRRYRNEIYTRYVVFTNFHVTGADGTPLTWREGLRTTFINPNTNQGYLEDGTVVDMGTLAPVGAWTANCLMAFDAAHGLLYGKRGQNLLVVAERGGAAPALLPPSLATLDDTLAIQAIRVSPDYPHDSTLLVELTGGGLLRSTDGGATFMRLHGGLPEPADIYPYILYGFFSPNYATDHAIYVTGHQAETLGAGVWRSVDGGDTFAPLWNDLIYRRGQDIVFSPNFVEDQALAVRAPFYDVSSSESGGALQLSLDGGLSWTVAVTIGNYATPTTAQLLDAAGLPWGPAHTAGIVIPGYGQAVVATLEDGAVLTTTLPMPDGALTGVLPAPDGATTYVYGATGIWRTLDGGATWESWDDDRLAGMTYANDIDAVAISPAFPDGSHRLFVGTADAQLWTLDPAQLTWASVAAASPTTGPPQAPTSTLRLPTPTPTLAPAVTPTPTTSAEPLTGEPPAGLFRPEGSSGIIWDGDAAMQQALGWATQAQPDSSQAADQPFEHGRMIWVQQQDSIYVIYDDGSWARYADGFEEGMAETDPTIVPPGGKLQPERGFGKVWREHADVRERIGWASAPERPADVQLHPFERGIMIRLGAAVYGLIGEESGTWLQ